MTFLKSRIHSPGVAATIALHAVFGIAMLQFDSTQSSAAAAPVMVSLVDSAGQEHAITPPKPTAAPRPVPKSSPAPMAEASALESSIALPTPVSTAEAPESIPAESHPMDDASMASSITLPRFNVDYLKNPPPLYPALSRRLGEQGRVMLRALVRADGTPAEVAIHRSSGSPRLDQAALDAVRRWRFVPARQGDTAIAAPVLVPISFTLQG